MFNFFLPASKVQKDRRIMRETDARLAKYSRRGLIFNFVAFVVCLAHGKFIDESPKLMALLTIGLLLNTLVRGIYLFRFDYLYPRAPAKWRNSYFVATLAGAIWWGIILASVTIVLDMKHEAPLLWLYTVIFFSSTAHAFAPYQKFLSYYQFFGQIPAAAAAFYLMHFDGYLYGIMMLVFYLVLTHQCRLISENYWERLEAIYALARKTQSMEEEKRDTKANVKLNQEFMKYLYGDISRFKSSVHTSAPLSQNEYRRKIQAELNKLHGNICDFNGVLSKELVLEDRVFNIRHEIQHLVAEFVDEAESNKVQIETSLSPTLPMRLRGDASRLAQIIRSLLNIILSDVEKCVVLVEVEFLREYESAGELYVSVTRSFDKTKKLFFNDAPPQIPESTLSLVVAKALADLMNGSIELNESLQDDQQFRFNAKIDIAEHVGQLDFHKDSFAGKNVLLVHNHPRIVDLKRQELDALGFNVFTETQYKRALITLHNSYKFQNPIESLVFYLEPDNQSVISFCESLLELPELKYTRKIGAATRKQQDIMRKNGFDEEHGFFYVDKPTGLFEVESVFYQLYKLSHEGDESEAGDDSVSVAMISQADAKLSVLKAHADEVADKVAIINANDNLANAIQGKGYQVVTLDCDALSDIAQVVAQIRAFEVEAKADSYLPIIGLSSSHELEGSAYELGLDDYIDLTHKPKKTFLSRVAYWATLNA